MDRGNDFLKARIHASAAEHRAFLKALEEHEAQADDARYRDVCTRYIATMRDHQRMLEDYQSELGAPSAGVLRRGSVATAGTAKNLADAVRESDFVRLTNDIDMSLKAEQSFKIFREAGRALGLRHLAEIGEAGERDHDAYKRDAARLAQQMFVERSRSADPRDTANRSSEVRR